MSRRLKYFLGLVLLVLLLFGFVAAAIWPDRPPRTDHRAELFQGVVYSRRVLLVPRPLMVHAVEIDLSAQGVGLRVTPGDETSGMDLYAQSTGTFVSEFGMQMAINGSFFKPFHAGTPFTYYPESGDPVDVKGLSISDGEIYSDDYVDFPVLCISAEQVQIRPSGCPANTVQALAGDPIFIEHGDPVVHSRSSYDTSPHPRTAVALDAQGERLWLVVVDGRQSGYSEGVTLAELADIVVGLGTEIALNLDGGGSSTLVVGDHQGARLLNSPIHTRIPMRQRPVANHLGVYALPVGGGD